MIQICDVRGWGGGREMREGERRAGPAAGGGNEGEEGGRKEGGRRK